MLVLLDPSVWVCAFVEPDRTCGRFVRRLLGSTDAARVDWFAAREHALEPRLLESLGANDVRVLSLAA